MHGSDATGNANPLAFSVITGWTGAFLSAFLNDMELETGKFWGVVGTFSEIAASEMTLLCLDIFESASSFAVVNGLERSLSSSSSSSSSSKSLVTKLETFIIYEEIITEMTKQLLYKQFAQLNPICSKAYHPKGIKKIIPQEHSFGKQAF